MPEESKVYTFWDDHSRHVVYSNLLKELQNKFQDGSEYDIEIKTHKRKKTVSQRGWFHKLCQIFADELGITQGQVKEIVKAQIFGWRHIKIGGVEIAVADGSSEDLSRLEYSDMIETIYRLAAESGVILPNPDVRMRNG